MKRWGRIAAYVCPAIVAFCVAYLYGPFALAMLCLVGATLFIQGFTEGIDWADRYPQPTQEPQP